MYQRIVNMMLKLIYLNDSTSTLGILLNKLTSASSLPLEQRKIIITTKYRHNFSSVKTYLSYKEPYFKYNSIKRRVLNAIKKLAMSGFYCNFTYQQFNRFIFDISDIFVRAITISSVSFFILNWIYVH